MQQASLESVPEIVDPREKQASELLAKCKESIDRNSFPARVDGMKYDEELRETVAAELRKAGYEVKCEGGFLIIQRSKMLKDAAMLCRKARTQPVSFDVSAYSHAEVRTMADLVRQILCQDGEATIETKRRQVSLNLDTNKPATKTMEDTTVISQGNRSVKLVRQEIIPASSK